VSLDQLQAGTAGPLIVRIEKINSDDRPRCDSGVVLERPVIVIDDSHDHVGSVCFYVERIPVDEVGYLARADVDLSFVTCDQVNVVLVDGADAAAHDARLGAESIKRRRVCIHLATFRSCSQLTDKTTEPMVGESLASTRSLDRRKLRVSPCCELQHGPGRRRTPRPANPAAPEFLDVGAVDDPTSSDTLPRKIA
jgi:hypothetical protein